MNNPVFLEISCSEKYSIKTFISTVESFAFPYPYNEQSFAEVSGFVNVVSLSADSGWIFLNSILQQEMYFSTSSRILNASYGPPPLLL